MNIFLLITIVKLGHTGGAFIWLIIGFLLT